MFTYNRGNNSPTLNQSKDYWSFRNGAKIIEFLTALDQIQPSPDFEQQSLAGSPLELSLAVGHCDLDRFMDGGNEILFDTDFIRENGTLCGRASQGIPHDYAANFVTSVFSLEYENCNFLQALTAMDYLTGIENNRKRKLREAAIRLGITRDTWSTVLAGEIDARHWVGKVHEKEFILAGCYAKIFINLRIWIMVAELQQLKFDKINAFALLNTLFPPCVKEIDSEKITAKVMYKYRAAIYYYVVDVEKNGPRAIDPFIARHLRPGTGCSWRETRHQLERYLEIALSMTRQAQDIYGIQSFRPTPFNDSRTSSSEGTSISSGRLRTNSSAHASFDSTLSPSEVSTTPGSTIYDNASVRSHLPRRSRTKAERGQNELMSSDPQFRNSTSSNPPSVTMPDENQSRRTPSETQFPVRVLTNLDTASSSTCNQEVQINSAEHQCNRSSHNISTMIHSGSVEHPTRSSTPDLHMCYPTRRKLFIVTGCPENPSSNSESPVELLASEPHTFPIHKNNRTGSASRFQAVVPPINTTLCNASRDRKFSNLTDSESPCSLVRQESPEVAQFMGTAVSNVLDRRIPHQISNQRQLDQSLQENQSNSEDDSYESYKPSTPIPARPIQTVIPGQTRLPSDNMAFLQRPYDSASTAQAETVLKKKASIKNLYLRSSAAVVSLNKKASSSSLKTNAFFSSSTPKQHPTTYDLLQSKPNVLDAVNRLETMLGPIKYLTESENFARYSQESSRTIPLIDYNESNYKTPEKTTATPFYTRVRKFAQVEPLNHYHNSSEQSFIDIIPLETVPGEHKKSTKRTALKKAKSFVVEKSSTGKKNALNNLPSEPVSSDSSNTAASIVTTAFNTSLNQRLQTKTSLSTLFSRSQNPESPTDARHLIYSAYNDSQESVSTARPTIRNAKSFTSLRTITSQKLSIKESFVTSGQERKDTNYTKGNMSPKRKDVNVNLLNEVKGASNPSQISSLPGCFLDSLDFDQKEYSRRWLIEDSKSRRDPNLNPPVGRPLEFNERMRKPHNKGTNIEITGKENEKYAVPEATKKALPRPERIRVDSIFPLKVAQKQKTKRLKLKETDTSKWESGWILGQTR